MFKASKNPSVTRRCRILLDANNIDDISATFSAVDLHLLGWIGAPLSRNFEILISLKISSNSDKICFWDAQFEYSFRIGNF
jgi:hypothetical protein